MGKKPHSIYLTLSSKALNHKEYLMSPEEEEKFRVVRIYAMERIRDMNGWA